jgi:hypothetical protein
MALPSQGKSLGVFQQEDGECRNYATAAIGHAQPGQAGTHAVAGSAAVGTVLGAATGAAIGAAAGGAGLGAAIGAATGLVGGTAVPRGLSRCPNYILDEVGIEMLGKDGQVGACGGAAGSSGAPPKRSTKRRATKTVIPSGSSVRDSSGSLDQPACAPSWLDELELDREQHETDHDLEEAMFGIES